MNNPPLTKRGLTILTLAYMVLPSALFLITWVRPVVGIPSLAALLILSGIAVRRLKSEEGAGKLPFTVIVSALATASVLCCFSEFGLIPYKSYDYVIHNYKYNLLATHDLPLYDRKYGIDMCYYLGFYMVPALLAKTVGVQYTDQIAFLWIGLGLTLCFIWLQLKMKLSEKKIPEQCLWLILLFGGAYVSALLPVFKWLTGDPFIYYNSIVLNDRFMLNQVPLFTRGLSEATQHTLPALLGFAFVLNVSGWKRGLFAAALMLLATTYWSPFTTIGLTAFVAVTGIRALLKGEEKLAAVILYGTGLLIAFYPVLLFLGSSEATSMASNRFIWQAGAAYWPFYYVLYAFAAYGVWIVLLGKKMAALDREALGIALVLLLCLGFVQIGFYNDLNIRTSAGMQLILGISVVYALIENRGRFGRSLPYTLAVLFFAANYLSVLRFYYERIFVLKGEVRNTIAHTATKVYEDNIYDVLEGAFTQNGKEAVKQYSLRKDSFFKRYLLKRHGPDLVK